MLDDLSRLNATDIDGLPFGYIALAADGTVRKYNRYEADLARKDPQEVLGRNFFRDIAPCTQVQAFEGRFRAFVAGENAAAVPSNEGSLSFDFEFRFRHGNQRVRIAFVRTPLPDEIIVTVNRVRDLAVSLSSGLAADPLAGTLADATGGPATVANADFWRATYELWRHLPGTRRNEALFRLGHLWGTSHLRRVERLVQREHGLALREAELQLALECLSGSLAVVGLGRFEADFSQRERGLVLLRHEGSPFARLFNDEQEPVCVPLAGLHAAFLGYLAGQALSAVELVCSRAAGERCLFAVGSEKRLARLLDDAEGSPDAGLLAQLRGSASQSGIAP